MEDNLRLIRLHDKHLRRLSRRDSTRKARRQAITRLALDLGCSLLTVTERDLLAWQDRCRARLAIKSIYVYSSHAREFFLWLHQAGHLEENPAAELPMPRVHRGRPRPIPTEDLVVALRCAPEPHRTWLLLMALCGMRCCDLAWLQRDCLRDGVLSFETKGGKWRSVPCPPEARDALSRYLHRPGAVFVTRTGRPYRPDDISGTVAYFLHSIGVPFEAHSLRHWFATEFHRRTRNLPLTQQVMGHESVESTMVYVAVSTREGHDTVAAMGVELAAVLDVRSGRAHDRAAMATDEAA